MIKNRLCKVALEQMRENVMTELREEGRIVNSSELEDQLVAELEESIDSLTGARYVPKLLDNKWFNELLKLLYDDSLVTSVLKDCEEAAESEISGNLKVILAYRYALRVQAISVQMQALNEVHEAGGAVEAKLAEIDEFLKRHGQCRISRSLMWMPERVQDLMAEVRVLRERLEERSC